MSDYQKYYTETKKLGQGSFGTVYLAEHLKARIKVAIKTVEKAGLKDPNYKVLMQ